MGVNEQRAEGVGPQHRFTMDGHNDALYYAGLNGGIERFDAGWPEAQLSLPGLRKGDIDACFFALFGSEEEELEHRPALAAREVDAMMGGYLDWLEASPDYRLIRSATDLCAVALAAEDSGAKDTSLLNPFGALLHLEGARGIGDLNHLHGLYESGLRSVGLTWNKANAYATGAHGDPAEGLTPRGRELVRELEWLNMVVDAAHLNRQGLADLLEIATRPVLVTHTGCRALFDTPRNLDDDQLRAVADSGGAIGIYCVNIFLAAPGEQVTLDTMVEHYQHLAEVVGIEHVVLGTDLGGISSGVPTGLERVDDLPNLFAALRKVGWSDDDIALLAGGNYLRILSGLLAD